MDAARVKSPLLREQVDAIVTVNNLPKQFLPGSLVNFELRVRDSLSQPLLSPDVVVRARSASGQVVTCTVARAGDSDTTFACTVRPLAEESLHIAIEVGGAAISGSPFALRPVLKVFIAGVVVLGGMAAACCSLVGAGVSPHLVVRSMLSTPRLSIDEGNVPVGETRLLQRFDGWLVSGDVADGVPAETALDETARDEKPAERSMARKLFDRKFGRTTEHLIESNSPTDGMPLFSAALHVDGELGQGGAPSVPSAQWCISFDRTAVDNRAHVRG